MAKRIVKLRHRMVRALDFPAEAVEGLPKIQLLGREHMLVESHRGVYEYRTRRLRVQTRCGMLCVEGEALVLRELGRDRLYVGGDITGFYYEPTP